MGVGSAATSGASLSRTSGGGLTRPSMNGITVMFRFMVTNLNGTNKIVCAFEGGGYFAWGFETGGGQTLYCDNASFGTGTIPPADVWLDGYMKADPATNIAIAGWARRHDATWTKTTNSDITNFSCTEFYLLRSAPGDWFNGKISDVKLWEALLTDAELDLERARARPVRQANLWGYWPLWRLGNTKDYSGNGRDFAENGSLTDQDNAPIRHVRPPVTVSPAVGGGGGDIEVAAALTSGADTLSADITPVVEVAAALTSGADTMAADIGVEVEVAAALTSGTDSLAANIETENQVAVALLSGTDSLAATVKPKIDVAVVLASGADTLAADISMSTGVAAALTSGNDTLAAEVGIELELAAQLGSGADSLAAGVGVELELAGAMSDEAAPGRLSALLGEAAGSGDSADDFFLVGP